MHPAFSVVLFTTLAGAGQGLFLAVCLVQALAGAGTVTPPGQAFFVSGSVLSLLLLGAGLVASFFHLGHPERAWRTAAMWRTSWLSREVIVLPVLMWLVALHAAVHYWSWGTEGARLVVAAAGAVAALALFVSTAMIYACVRFIREWATPLTVINYTLLGSACGFTLAVALAAFGTAPHLVGLLAASAIVLGLAAFVGRIASLVRNAGLAPVSTLQTAIGVRHERIRQLSQGASAGSFNTREFFHGARDTMLRAVRGVFLALIFPVPLVLLLAGLALTSAPAMVAAFVVQYAGLVAERWYFFAQANHPQNLYYQRVS